MGRRSTSNSINTILRDFRDMDPDSFRLLYGVTIEEGGAIYDPTYQKTFKNIQAWAAYTSEQEEGDVGGIEKLNERYAYDDESF